MAAIFEAEPQPLPLDRAPGFFERLVGRLIEPLIDNIQAFTTVSTPQGYEDYRRALELQDSQRQPEDT